MREWLLASYPAAVIRRFFELELLDRAFGLAAQAFVALLPLVIVIVSVFVEDTGEVISEQIGTRFGLDDAARTAIRGLFAESDDVKVVSWLAIAITAISAFSLARRLSRVFARIFDVPPLQRSESWRGLVWIGLQMAMFVAASTLRDIRSGSGVVAATLAVVTLIAVWFGADYAGLRLLVPSASRRLTVASAMVSSVGRVGLSAWAAIYFPPSLSDQAAQFGPIGVTFAIFTYILAGVLVYVTAPLLVTTWVQWRAGRRPAIP
jgi:membrane protein